MLPLSSRLASSGLVTRLESAAVSEMTRVRYEQAFATFDQWCRQNRLGPAVADPQLDLKIADYLDALLLKGAQRTEAEYAVSAVRAMLPQYSGRSGVGLPRAERALKGFRRLRPSKSRYPMPWPLTAATIMALWALNQSQMALMVLLLHVCYLRPGEARQLRVEDLLAPGVQSKAWAVVIAPQSRGEVSKTLTSDDTIFIDWPSWVGALLSELKQGRQGHEFLFPGPPTSMRQEWSKIQEALGVPNACLYQLRHGGASSDVLYRRRPMLEVMARGRWSSQATLKRYCKAGKLEYLLGRLTDANRRYAMWCDRNLEAVLAGGRPARLPPAMGGGIPSEDYAGPAPRPPPVPQKRSSPKQTSSPGSKKTRLS